MAKAQSPFLFCQDRGQSEQPEDLWLNVTHEEIKRSAESQSTAVCFQCDLDVNRRLTLNLVSDERMLKIKNVWPLNGSSSDCCILMTLMLEAKT